MRALGLFLLRILGRVPEALREPLLAGAERLRSVLEGRVPQSLVGFAFEALPRVFELLGPLVTRLLDDPRLLVELLERMQPVALEVLTWIESHEPSTEQLERALAAVSAQLLALASGDGATADAERLLESIETMTASWLEALTRHLGDGSEKP